MKAHLGDRYWSKVNKDAPGGCWLWTAPLKSNGYGQFRFDRRMKYAHRLSYEDAFGPIPDGMQVDHVCWDRACVNPDHLRIATNRMNGQNRSGARTDSKSGIRGVYWQKHWRKWMARARTNGQVVYLGTYGTAKEAEAVVTEWRREHMPYSVMDQAPLRQAGICEDIG